jgi:hypothetical protein
MGNKGITAAYEAEMKTMDFGAYARTIIGDPPVVPGVEYHAHHILFKTGNGVAQKMLVQEGQDILRRYGIDPVVGPELFVWAPSKVKGQHDVIALEQVVEALKQADVEGGTYNDIVDALRNMGEIAKAR